jgi:TatD DNase family protein
MDFKYVDVHTHINLDAFDGDWKETTKRAHDVSIAHINVGTQLATSKRAVELAQQYEEGVFATIGRHPVHSSKEDSEEGSGFDTKTYRTLAEHAKVVAIGECGLDYYRVDPDMKERQEAAFVAQIELANELGKPLMLHVRPSTDPSAPKAYADAFEIVKAHAKVRGNVHFFAGSVEEARRFWDIGYSTSFTGVITFTSDYDEQVRAAPKDLIHAETDAPYVAPKPFRGTRNEPANVIEVIKRMAELRGEEFDVWAEQLRANAKEMFNI